MEVNQIYLHTMQTRPHTRQQNSKNAARRLAEPGSRTFGEYTRTCWMRMAQLRQFNKWPTHWAPHSFSEALTSPKRLEHVGLRFDDSAFKGHMRQRRQFSEAEDNASDADEPEGESVGNLFSKAPRVKTGIWTPEMVELDPIWKWRIWTFETVVVPFGVPWHHLPMPDSGQTKSMA